MKDVNDFLDHEANQSLASSQEWVQVFGGMVWELVMSMIRLVDSYSSDEVSLPYDI